MTGENDSTGASQATSEVVFGVPDMDCASCARRISERLEKLDGVGKAEPRVVSKDLRIEFDAETMSEATKAQENKAVQETPAVQESQESQAAQGKSFYNEVLETAEKVPGVTGEYAGKIARLLFNPLYHIHKHSTAPFIEQFKKAFNEDK